MLNTLQDERTMDVLSSPYLFLAPPTHPMSMRAAPPPLPLPISLLLPIRSASLSPQEAQAQVLHKLHVTGVK